MIEDIFTLPKHSIDVVLCLDGTGSMCRYIEAMKKNARKLYEGILSQIADFQKEIESIRVKLIVFRDYRTHCEENVAAIEESPFFSLPDGEGDLASYVEQITVCGGGDSAENGLEALYYAMRSDFGVGSRNRQVIILLTDADAHELGACRSVEGYPADMVDEEGLIALWEGTHPSTTTCLSGRKRRMMLFAPMYSRYQMLTDKLDYCFFEPIEESEQLFAEEAIDDLAKLITYRVLFGY